MKPWGEQIIAVLWPFHDIKKRNHEFTNWKCCIKSRESFKTPFNCVLFLTYQFKKNILSSFYILKALKDILQHFKIVNWWIGGSVFWCHEQLTNFPRSFKLVKSSQVSWISLMDGRLFDIFNHKKLRSVITTYTVNKIIKK